jgi:N-dimethylarginine dimethylaminohydrolase
MITININNEIGRLRSVILGAASDFGGTPKEVDCYDPKSKENVLNGTFPTEQDLSDELNKFREVLEKYNVKVFRPEIIQNLNQIFIRDIAFVIDDKIIVPNIISNRSNEINGINYLLKDIDSKKILRLGVDSMVEGGDVILSDNKIFIGYSKENDFIKYKVSRTNERAIEEIRSFFPNKEVLSFELNKSDTDAKKNALHLDCCFQPIGKNMAIIYEGSFKKNKDIDYLNNHFRSDNLIKITQEEMYNMNSNIFSISKDVIVSEKGFNRLNSILREKGFVVEEINFSETAKMEGLLRCSTLPLYRL